MSDKNSAASNKLREEATSRRLKRNVGDQRREVARNAAKVGAGRMAMSVAGRAVPAVGAGMMAAKVVSEARKKATAGAASKPKREMQRAGRQEYRKPKK